MYYTVMTGDTMYKIATQFGVALDDLLKANPDIANPDLIYPGKVIVIPTPEIPGDELPIPGMSPGQPPAVSPQGFPGMPPGGGIGELPGMPELPDLLKMSGFPPGGTMSGLPPGGMMPVFPPGGMIPGGEMGAGMALTLKTGDKGNQVKYLQKRLKELGYYNGPLSGHFGPKTKNAVKKFQKACRVTVNGIADQFLLQTLG